MTYPGGWRYVVVDAATFYLLFGSGALAAFCVVAALLFLLGFTAGLSAKGRAP